MNSTAVVRVADSTALAPNPDPGSLEQARNHLPSQTLKDQESGRTQENEQAALQISLTTELDLGFSFMTRATAFRHSCQPAEFEECLERASAACEKARKLLGELPPNKAATFHMRLNALQSIVLDSTNTGLTRAMARG